MTSGEAYAIAAKLSNYASNVGEIIGDFELAKTAVNVEQLGAIPEAVTENINNKISALEIAQKNLTTASEKAKSYADELYKKEQEALKKQNQVQ